MDQDFIVSSLLSELKDENERKSKLIRGLLKVICGCVAAILVTIGGFLWYLNQYDFTSSEASIATGFYALVDSEGNIISQDLSVEDLEKIEEVIKDYGSGSESKDQVKD